MARTCVRPPVHPNRIPPPDQPPGLPGERRATSSKKYTGPEKAGYNDIRGYFINIYGDLQEIFMQRVILCCIGAGFGYNSFFALPHGAA